MDIRVQHGELLIRKADLKDSIESLEDKLCDEQIKQDNDQAIWDLQNEIEEMEDAKRDIEKKLNKLRSSAPGLDEEQDKTDYESNQIALQGLGTTGTGIDSRCINGFIDRLKFDPAQNEDRQGDDKREPTCPVCQQWVDKTTLRIKPNMRVS